MKGFVTILKHCDYPKPPRFKQGVDDKHSFTIHWTLH